MPTPLINRKKVKIYTLDMASNTRVHRFTRVSEEFLTACEAVLKEHIRKHLHGLPSVGKTIR